MSPKIWHAGHVSTSNGGELSPLVRMASAHSASPLSRQPSISHRMRFKLPHLGKGSVITTSATSIPPMWLCGRRSSDATLIPILTSPYRPAGSDCGLGLLPTRPFKALSAARYSFDHTAHQVSTWPDAFVVGLHGATAVLALTAGTARRR